MGGSPGCPLSRNGGRTTPHTFGGESWMFVTDVTVTAFAPLGGSLAAPLPWKLKEGLRSGIAILGYGPDTSIYPLKDCYLLHYIV